MGFYLMIILAILGILLVIVGVSRKKKHAKSTLLIGIGIILILAAIFLAWPK